MFVSIKACVHAAEYGGFLLTYKSFDAIDQKAKHDQTFHDEFRSVTDKVIEMFNQKVLSKRLRGTKKQDIQKELIQLRKQVVSTKQTSKVKVLTKATGMTVARYMETHGGRTPQQDGLEVQDVEYEGIMQPCVLFREKPKGEFSVEMSSAASSVLETVYDDGAAVVREGQAATKFTALQDRIAKHVDMSIASAPQSSNDFGKGGKGTAGKEDEEEASESGSECGELDFFDSGFGLKQHSTSAAARSSVQAQPQPKKPTGKKLAQPTIVPGAASGSGLRASKKRQLDISVPAPASPSLRRSTAVDDDDKSGSARKAGRPSVYSGKSKEEILEDVGLTAVYKKVNLGLPRGRVSPPLFWKALAPPPPTPGWRRP